MHRGTALQPKEDDEPFVSSQNSLAYDFEKHKVLCTSIQSTYFDLLLGYKIERRPMAHDEPDQYFSLNAVSESPVDLAECAIRIDESKHKYLSEAKDGTIARIGLRGYPKERLEEAIRAKLYSTYIYRLRFSAEHAFAGFSVLLELDAIGSDEPVRVTAGFGFDESRNIIRLVTLF